MNVGSSISGQGAAPLVTYVDGLGYWFSPLSVGPELPQPYPIVTSTN